MRNERRVIQNIVICLDVNLSRKVGRGAPSAIKESGTTGVREDQMGKYFDAVHWTMCEKHGAWHGFNEMFVLNLVPDLIGEAPGY